MAFKVVGKVSSSICMVISRVHGGKKTDEMLMMASFLPVFFQLTLHFFYCSFALLMGVWVWSLSEGFLALPFLLLQLEMSPCRSCCTMAAPTTR